MHRVLGEAGEVDARAWLAEVLARIADNLASTVADLLPCNWKVTRSAAPAT